VTESESEAPSALIGMTVEDTLTVGASATWRDARLSVHSKIGTANWESDHEV
jgi:hypothetical protein